MTGPSLTAWTEEWRRLDIHPCYWISNLGRVEYRRGKICRPVRLRKYGNRGSVYCFNVKSGEVLTIPAHAQMLRSFIRDPLPGEKCRHLDGNPKNGRLDNLAWGRPGKVGLGNQKEGSRTGAEIADRAAELLPEPEARAGQVGAQNRLPLASNSGRGT